MLQTLGINARPDLFVSPLLPTARLEEHEGPDGGARPHTFDSKAKA